MDIVLEKEVEIKKITRGKYVALAKSTKPMVIEFSVGGNTEEECRSKFNKMFPNYSIEKPKDDSAY